MAVQESQIWCDEPGNRAELAQIVSGRQWINCPVPDILPRLQGRFDYGTGKIVENSPHTMKFWKDDASYPYRSHELWFLVEGVRWGKFRTDEDLEALVAEVNREDLWREAAKELGVPAAQVPKSTSRGVERFFDGKVFDPADPAAYLASLAIKKSG
jgi:nitrate/nitrite transport system substrate-binding protein